MIVNRRIGDRLRIEMLPVGRQRTQVHLLLESDLTVAWSRVSRSNDPRYDTPRFASDHDGWIVISSLTGERLAKISLTPPPKGRPRP